MDQLVKRTGYALSAASCLAEQRLLINQTIVATIVNDAGARLELFRRIKSIEMDGLSRHGSPPPITSVLARLHDGEGSADEPADADRGQGLHHPMIRTLGSLAFHAPELCQDIVGGFGENPDRALSLLHDLRACVPVYLLFSDRSYPAGGGESFFHYSCRILSELGFRCIWVTFSDGLGAHPQDGTAFTPYFEEVRLAAGAGLEAIERTIAQSKPDLIHSHGALNKTVGPLAWRHRVPAMLGHHDWSGLLHLADTSGSAGIISDLARVAAAPPALEEPPPYITCYAASEAMREVYLACGGRANLRAYDLTDPAERQSTSANSSDANEAATAPKNTDGPDADIASWIAAVSALDRNPTPAGGKVRQNHRIDRARSIVRAFINDAITHTGLSPKRNVGLYAPWSEQGLGELARIYGRALRRSGLGVHVLSFQAYEAKDRGVAIQHSADDWAAGKDADTIHYSLNDREHVTLHEISQFISTKNIGRLIYPELRLLANWQKIANLKIRNLATIAVPMIESVGRSEAANHNYLHSTWCVTRQCRDVLHNMGVKNAAYIGHGFGPRLTPEAIQQKKAATLSRETIVFCHMGGHNPHFRKQTAKVVEAFALAAEKRDDISLRVYMMRNFSGISQAYHPRISYHLGSLPHDEILAAYRSSDVSIQVASHEGLGLGFYESLAMGTPILSLDLAPHNEVVRPGISGWLLPVQPAPRAHPQGMVPGGYFDVRDLADAIVRIAKQEVVDMIDTAAELHRGMFDEYALTERLATALWRHPELEREGPRR